MILFNFIRYLIIHIKYSSIISKAFKEEKLLDNLSKLFGVEFKQDWVGRTYAIINPNIINGVYDHVSQIYEYNDLGLDNRVYVEKWIMQRFNIISNFVKTNNLFDILIYDLKKIDEYDNYLFTLYPVTFEDFNKYLKLLPISISIIGIIVFCINYFKINIFI